MNGNLPAMKTLCAITLSALGLAALPAREAAPPSTTPPVRQLKDRSERGKLADASETVRGDSGKWNDAPKLQPMPAPARKPSGRSLDDWADEISATPYQPKPGDENWVLFRSRQLDDNDRVWVESVERQGNAFVIVSNEAVWQGNYFKTFTYYQALAINLGRLEPGRYTVKWIVKPLEFTRFEDPGRPQDNWPKDEKPANQKPVELTTAFTVTTSPR